jgi:GT2 family glycosyltransferase
MGAGPSVVSEPLPDVSVVIVNWNAGEYLTRAVASVFADPFPGAVEVLVVDNASSDDSIARLRATESRAHVVQRTENTGFARGCNAGIRASRGRHLLLLNPDAELRPGALAALMGAADAYPDAGVLGGVVVAPDGVVDPASRRNVPTPAMALTRLVGVPWIARLLVPAYNVEATRKERAPEVGAVSGSFLLLRRSVFEALNGFDERFFLYAEDLDLCHRARIAGWTVRSVTAAEAVHHKHVCAAKAPYRALWYFYWTMILFHSKHYAARHWRIVNLAVYAAVVTLFAVRVVGVAVGRRRDRFRLATRPPLATSGTRAGGALSFRRGR